MNILMKWFRRLFTGISLDGWKRVNLGDYSAPIYSKPINSSTILDTNRGGWIEINVDRESARFYPVRTGGWIHEVDVKYATERK